MAKKKRKKKTQRGLRLLGAYGILCGTEHSQLDWMSIHHETPGFRRFVERLGVELSYTELLLLRQGFAAGFQHVRREIYNLYDDMRKNK